MLTDYAPMNRKGKWIAMLSVNARGRTKRHLGEGADPRVRWRRLF